jgi:O-antigen ligase
MKILERVSKITLALFFILVPIAFVSRGFVNNSYFYRVYLLTPTKEAVARMFVLFLLILFLLEIALFKKAVQKTALYLPMFFILLLGAFSLIGSMNFHQGFEQWIHWASLFLFFFVCLNLVEDISSIRNLMKIGVFTGALVCFISILCYFFHFDLPFFLKKREFWWGVTFDNPKLIAEYLAPLFFWVSGFFFTKTDSRRIWEKRIYALISAFFLFGILFVFKSRAAALGLMVPFLFLVFVFRPLLALLARKRIVAALSCIAILLLSLPLLKQTFDGKYTNNLQRLVIWKNAALIGKDHWLKGAGLGQFDLVYPTYATPKDRFSIPETQFWNDYIHHAHNEYLQIFSEIGLLGLCLFAFLLYFLFRQIRSYLKSESDETRRVLCYSLMLSLLSHFTIALFVYNFQTAPSAFFAMAAMAFLIKLTGSPKRDHAQKETRNFTRPRKVFSFALIPFLLLFAPKFLIQNTFTKYHLHLGESLLEYSPKKAKEAFEKALRWNPNEWRAYFFLGNISADHKNYEQAISYLKHSLRFNPYHVATLFNLALYYERSGADEDAIQTYASMLSFAPDFRMANNRLGQIYVKNHRFDDAKRYFWKALQPAAYQNGELPKALFGLFLCESKLNQPEKALALLREVYLAHQKDFTVHPNYFRLQEEPTDIFQWWLEHL